MQNKGLKCPFYIGGVKLSNNIFLAPMAGVADAPFRLICKEQGCGLVYTEMVSAKGVHYKSRPSMELAAISDLEKPAAVQIFGSDPHIMAEAAQIFEDMGAAIIDINMGCPTPKVTSNGDGAALMKEPALAGEVIKAVVNAVHIPVTVKMRRGFDESCENALELAKIAECSGAAAVTIHGRYREQFYSGKSDRKIIKKVKDAVKIPVIGNGDIFNSSDAKQLFEETGCDAIMIARGSEGNPWIFNEIITYLSQGKELPAPTAGDLLNMIKKHLLLSIESKGEEIGIKEMRKHIAWYLKGMKNSAAIRDMVFKCTTLDSIINILDNYFEELYEIN